MRIVSRQQLQAWLEEHGWFEDGFISRISAPDEPLQLTIGYQMSGSLIAGDPKRTVEFDLLPQAVSLWNGPSTVDPEDLIEGIGLIDEGLGIEVDFPKIHLACAEIEVSEPRYFDTLTKPWTSDREVDVSMSGTVPPTPQFWIDAFHKNGLNVGFRYLGSEMIEADNVPFPNYSGYFIQHLDRMSESQYGLFVFAIWPKDNRCMIRLQDDHQSSDLLQVAHRIMSSWQVLEVHCGNVRLKGQEAAEFLRSGRLPERLSSLV